MYILAHFEESRPEAPYDLIAQNPLGTLVTHGEHGPDTNHTPFLLLPEGGKPGVLHAHMACTNSVWKDAASGDEVLITSRAGDAYTSPMWYPSKHEAHRQVPTWNYRVVHTRGRTTVRDDEYFVCGVVVHLIRTYEVSQPAPWKMSDAPSDYIDALLRMIVGIEVEITRIEGRFGLSQNKETRDIAGAGEALRTSGERVIGNTMLACAAVKTE